MKSRSMARGLTILAAVTVVSTAVAGQVEADFAATSPTLGALSQSVDLSGVVADGDSPARAESARGAGVTPTDVGRIDKDGDADGSWPNSGKDWRERHGDNGEGSERFHGIRQAGADGVVPLPPTAWLLGSALGLLVLRRRRSSNS